MASCRCAGGRGCRNGGRQVSTPIAPLQASAALPMLWIVLALPDRGSAAAAAAASGPPVLAYAMAAAGGCVASLTGPNLKAALLNTNPAAHRAAVFTLAYLFDSVAKGLAPTLIGLVMLYADSLAGSSAGPGAPAQLLSRQSVFAVGLCGWVVSGAVIATASLSAGADERAAGGAAQHVE